MSLERTTIITTNDIPAAEKQFQSLVCSGKSLVVVVLGDDTASRKAAECADRRAGVIVSGIGREVVWVKDKNALANDIKSLKPGTVDISTENLTDVVAFSVSLNSTTMDVIHENDNIDFLRMKTAFVSAGTV